MRMRTTKDLMCKRFLNSECLICGAPLGEDTVYVSYKNFKGAKVCTSHHYPGKEKYAGA